MKKRSKKITSVIISIIVIITFIYQNIDTIKETLGIKEKETITTMVRDDLEIHFIDVGQADCILIMNNNQNVLIDAGNNEDGSKLTEYIKSLKINKFNYVIGTHPHEDHIGGLDDVINNFEIDNIMLPEAYTTTKTFEDVLDSIDNNEKTITVPEIGENFQVGDAYFEILYTGTNTSDLNNTSIVLKMTYGNKKYLFTGDATSSSEQKMLSQDIDVDVLKVGHHGSKYSTTDEFLSATTPNYAIISVGDNNSYGHPAAETIKKLEENNIKTYKTNELGTIILKSDGKNIEISNVATDTNG